MRSSNMMLRVAVTILLLLFAFSCVGCSKEDEPDVNARVDYDSIKPSDYIRLDGYTDMSLTLYGTEASKSETVWAAVMSRAEVLSYPEEQVAYYTEQSRATYRYYAKQNDWSYEETLEKLGTSEEEILSQAKEMVKGDLVYRYIVEDADIALTEEEKISLLDRYAKHYVEQYGYPLDYVKENMRDLIYDSMLYDKTMEYLIVHNMFTVEE